MHFHLVGFRLSAVLTLERLELVTREEFDVQRKVLQRTRARLEALEAELRRLEQAGAEDSGAGA